MVLAHDITKGERTQDVIINQDVTFETMLLAPNTLQGLKNAGFYKPSPIQLYGIPIGKCGFDLLLEAKSGTGKTAVFSVIALETIDLQKGLQVVILTPTREIAAQISDVLHEIGSRFKDLQIAVVMGGLPFQEDVEKFKKTVHIVVGSPGRLKHLIQNKNINTAAVRLLVLDEADKLMDKSFQSDIKFIYTMLPKQKQVIMSSATYSDSAKAFINDYMQNANHVCPDSDSILIGIKQKVTFVKYNSNIVRLTQDKFKELLKILAKIQFKQCLVFCNYQARVSEVNKLLKKEKWPSEMLSGQQDQIDRLDALKTLQQYKCRILVSTDLAARGIDASNIDLIVNFEPPHEWQTYLHRIGRAGRFGSHGIAITILGEGKETQNFKDMFKSMELLLNIHHLWTDKEFNVETSATPKESCNSASQNSESSDICEKINHGNIWDVLSKSTKETNAIESFDNLFKSHKNLEIDTFSNLMSSMHLRKNENNEEKPLFKHIEMKTLSPDRLLATNKYMDSQNNDQNVKEIYKYINTDTNDDTSDTSIKSKENVTTDINDNCLNLKNTLFNGKNALCSRQSPKSNIIKLENDNYSTLKKHETLSNLSDYSNSIFENKNSKDIEMDSLRYVKITQTENRTQDYLNNDHNLCDIPYSHTEIKSDNINNQNASHKKKNMSHYKESKYKIKDPDCNFNIKFHERTQSYSKINYEKIRLLKYEYQKKLYVNWYNQLKLRMQYIEQAIYTDEMSRL